jgi:hypothetical protein
LPVIATKKHNKIPREIKRGQSEVIKEERLKISKNEENLGLSIYSEEEDLKRQSEEERIKRKSFPYRQSFYYTPSPTSKPSLSHQHPHSKHIENTAALSDALCPCMKKEEATKEALNQWNGGRSCGGIGIGIGEEKEIRICNMEDAKLNDLVIRIGYPYLYRHQSCCDHVFIIRDIAIVEYRSPREMNMQKYPYSIFRAAIKRRRCSICHLYHAKLALFLFSLTFLTFLDLCFKIRN